MELCAWGGMRTSSLSEQIRHRLARWMLQDCRKAHIDGNMTVAGYSAEEISTPHQFQPYGDLFAIDTDGTNLRRLTHGKIFFLHP